MSTPLTPPPTIAELELAATIADLTGPFDYATNRAMFGQSYTNDPHVDRIIAALRAGGAVFVPSPSTARKLRRVFPRATCIVRASESRPRLAPDAMPWTGKPAPCVRCDLEEARDELAAEHVPDADTSAIEAAAARIAAAPVHSCAGECRIRWRCDSCQSIYSLVELEENANRCPRACPSGGSFTGWYVGRLN